MHRNWNYWLWRPEPGDKGRVDLVEQLWLCLSVVLLVLCVIRYCRFNLTERCFFIIYGLAEQNCDLCLVMK